MRSKAVAAYRCLITFVQDPQTATFDWNVHQSNTLVDPSATKRTLANNVAIGVAKLDKLYKAIDWVHDRLAGDAVDLTYASRLARLIVPGDEASNFRA